MSDSQMARIYGMLRNPYRRKIVDLLRSKGQLGFKELHAELGISVGALYHHLDVLEGVVGQESNKKYVLTSQGQSAIDTLSVGEEKIAAATVVQQGTSENLVSSIANELFLGRRLFNYIGEEPLRTFPLALVIVLFGGWLSSQTNLEPILMFYVNPTSGLSGLWLVLLFPLGWLATFAVAEILSVLLYHRPGGEVNLLNGIAFSMLPLLIVPSIYYLTGLFGLGLNSATLTLLPILMQAWIVCLLSTSISISKGLRIEKTAVISLGVMYLNILALLVALELRIF